MFAVLLSFGNDGIKKYFLIKHRNKKKIEREIEEAQKRQISERQKILKGKVRG